MTLFLKNQSYKSLNAKLLYLKSSLNRKKLPGKQSSFYKKTQTLEEVIELFKI